MFVPTKLLYPVEQKNYTEDKFINGEWERLKYWLNKENKSVQATVFGYGAPVSDVEAVSLLNSAWGTSEERNMEQFEIIDTAPENELRKRWGGFIHSHHYDVTDNYFSSSLAHNPRRSCESYHSFDYLIGVKDKKIDNYTIHRYIPIGVRVGYYLQTSNSNWKVDGNYNLNNGPNNKQSNIFINVNICLGYKVQRP